MYAHLGKISFLSSKTVIIVHEISAENMSFMLVLCKRSNVGDIIVEEVYNSFDGDVTAYQNINFAEPFLMSGILLEH
jgi:hypothetical protein